VKVEVMVDKDNTHFSYKFEGDLRIIDGSKHSAFEGGKLVIMTKDKDNYKTTAVFNVWSLWRIIDTKDEKLSKVIMAFENAKKNWKSIDDLESEVLKILKSP